MNASFFNQIHYKNKIENIFEEYCAVLPNFLGKTVKHYQQHDDKNFVPISTPSTNNWKNTAKNIAILLSHITLVVPLAMYIGKAINRKLTPFTISPPALLDPNNHKYLEKAKEIRKLREDSKYIPKECKGARLAIRFNLPADSIMEEMEPGSSFAKQMLNLRNNLLKNVETLSHSIKPEKKENKFFNNDLNQKQKLILSPNFNNFSCAHGIEELKGGKRNLLNAMIEGVLRAPCSGGLMDGPSDCVAGPHGPYYVILNSKEASSAGRRYGLWSEKGQIAYLVPSQETREFLEKGLTIAVERGYITEEEKNRSLRKVITYDEFIQLPHSVRHSERMLKNWLDRA